MIQTQHSIFTVLQSFFTISFAFFTVLFFLFRVQECKRVFFSAFFFRPAPMNTASPLPWAGHPPHPSVQAISAPAFQQPTRGLDLSGKHQQVSTVATLIPRCWTMLVHYSSITFPLAFSPVEHTPESHLLALTNIISHESCLPSAHFYCFPGWLITTE